MQNRRVSRSNRIIPYSLFDKVELLIPLPAKSPNHEPVLQRFPRKLAALRPFGGLRVASRELGAALRQAQALWAAGHPPLQATVRQGSVPPPASAHIRSSIPVWASQDGARRTARKPDLSMQEECFWSFFLLLFLCEQLSPIPKWDRPRTLLCVGSALLRRFASDQGRDRHPLRPTIPDRLIGDATVILHLAMSAGVSDINKG